MVRLMEIAAAAWGHAPKLKLGMGPPVTGFIPMPAVKRLLSGVSRDSTGAALPGCTCTLFLVTTDALGRLLYTQMDQTVSDAVTGAYSFNVAQAAAYRVTFDLAGAPIRAGITLDTLKGDDFGS